MFLYGYRGKYRDYECEGESPEDEDPCTAGAAGWITVRHVSLLQGWGSKGHGRRPTPPAQAPAPPLIGRVHNPGQAIGSRPLEATQCSDRVSVHMGRDGGLTLAVEGSFPIFSEGAEPDILFRLGASRVPVVASTSLGGSDPPPACPGRCRVATSANPPGRGNPPPPTATPRSAPPPTSARARSRSNSERQSGSLHEGVSGG